MDEPELHREKNRVSYADSLVKVDLTHVQQPNKVSLSSSLPQAHAS